MYLPLGSNQTRTDGTAFDNDTGRPGPPRRMLLAADDPLNEKVAIGTLREAGHQITVARNGREAAEKVAADHFDVVLMDGQMPEMDGFSATTAIL